MNPRVKAVSPKENYLLDVTFTNDEHGIYDCSSLLELGVFQELRDPAYFYQVKAEQGTVVWPHEQDICPDTLYEDSKKWPRMAFTIYYSTLINNTLPSLLNASITSGVRVPTTHNLRLTIHSRSGLIDTL